MAASQAPRAASKSFLKQLSALRSKGVTLGEHVSMSNSTASKKLDTCPFLSTHPLLSHTAAREANARSYNRKFPIAVTKAEGALIYDEEGNEYLDALAGAGTLSMGHNHPVLVEAAQQFLASGKPQQLLDLSSPVKDDFVDALMTAMPKEMHDTGPLRVQFCSPAGTDVTEAAVKLAKRTTGRGNVLCFSGAYHGHTAGALSLMGNLGAKTGVPNLPAGAHMLPYPYEYRCPFGIGKEGHHVIATYIERLLDDVESGIVAPAALIVECVQGEGGVIPAPVEFLRRVRDVTQRHGILMIVDEVQSGIGRTGKMFAFEHAGIAPDIVCLSKAVGGGFPLGCMVYRTDTINEDMWGPGSHAGTFRGNQIAMVTGAAWLRYTMEHDLAGQAAAKGEYVVKRMHEVQQRHPLIGDVRGRGLMLGFEIVDPNAEPDSIGARPASGEIAADIQTRCFAKGLLIERGGRHGAVLRLLCPLVTTDDQLAEMIDIMSVAIDEAAADLEK